LKLRGFDGENDELVDNLKQKAVTLLLSLMEGPPDQAIITRMAQSMDDFKIVFQRIQFVYERFIEENLGLSAETASLRQVNDCLQKDDLDGSVMEGFHLYNLINMLSDAFPEKKKPKPGSAQGFADTPEVKRQKAAYEFFEYHTGSIEALIEGNLYRVYFPIRPVCRYLSDESQEQVMLTVDRESPQHKIMGLLKAAHDLIDEMNQVEMLARARVQITPQRLSFLRDISFLIALVMNVIMLVYFKYEQQPREDGAINIKPSIPDWANLTIDVLGYVQLGLSILILLCWCITKAALVTKSKWRQLIDETRAREIDAEDVEKPIGIQTFRPASELSLYEVRKILRLKGPEADEFGPEGEDRDFGHLIVKLEYYWISFTFLLTHPTFKYLLAYIFLAVLGLRISLIFYTFQLLDVINRFPTLRNVIQSVTQNSTQLLMTAMLGIIIIYIYSVFGFEYLYDMYFDDTVNVEILNQRGEPLCSSMSHCFFSTINYGLRLGGGVGDSMSPASYLSKKEYYLRFFFDLTFFLIVVIILLNIIFGIIIDTFAELRDKKRNIEDDMKNRCFICNIERFQVMPLPLLS